MILIIDRVSGYIKPLSIKAFAVEDKYVKVTFQNDISYSFGKECVDRIDVHHTSVSLSIEDIHKAEMIYHSLKKCADMLERGDPNAKEQ
jgi:hypothetical protein